MATLNEVCKDTIHMCDYLMLKESIGDKWKSECKKLVAMATFLIAMSTLASAFAVTKIKNGAMRRSIVENLLPVIIAIIICITIIRAVKVINYYKVLYNKVAECANRIKVSETQIYKENAYTKDKKAVEMQFKGEDSGDIVTLYKNILYRRLHNPSVVMIHVKINEECIIYNINPDTYSDRSKSHKRV